MAVELSYCVMSAGRRQLLRYCLDAVARERAAVPFETEVVVLDNASGDGSASTARSHPTTTTVIASGQPRGRGESHSELLRRAHGRFCLLLDDDSELEPGATAALHDALAADERAGAAGATLVDPNGSPRPSAYRFPGVRCALLSLVGLNRRVVQSRGSEIRDVDWCPPLALLVRRDAAEAVGWFDPEFPAAGDATDFCKRLDDAGWHVLWVPDARAVHHDVEPPERDQARTWRRYLRKHHSAPAARVAEWLIALRPGRGR